MCQLIKVTWFIWKLSADQLIVLLDRDQCSISYFLASLGAQLIMRTYWTSMLRSIDSCHTGYPLPVSLELMAGSGSDAKIQPAVTGREDSCFLLCSPWSRVGHTLLPIFMLWLVKISQMSSCGKFIQHLESCLLLCQLVLYLTVFFHWMYKMKFSCYQESSVIHG